MKKLLVGDKCKYGHILEGQNVRHVRGSIRCGLCQTNAVKKYYAKNKHKILIRLKDKWKNSDGLKQYNKDLKRIHYSLNPDLCRNKAKDKWKNNLKYREYMKKFKSAPEIKLHSNISRAIREALKKNKNGRKWEEIVGYTRKELQFHLENKFKEGMTWDNYGRWEVDHIIPRSSFDFGKPDSITECWKLDNLQPLWMPENRSKYNRITI